MFDDFDMMQQVDEIIPEEYDDWCKWVYCSPFTKEEQQLYQAYLEKNSIDTGINILNFL